MSQSGFGWTRWGIGGSVAAVFAAVSAAAPHEECHGVGDGEAVRGTALPFIVLPAPDEESVIEHSGEVVNTEWIEIWKPICSSDTRGVGAADLLTWAQKHDTEFATMNPEDVIVIDSDGGVAGAGINIVFTLGSSVPSAAIASFTAIEAYLESLFADPITVTISVSFQAMGPGILGGTSTFYTTSTYSNARNGLINGQDADDTIQDSLPTGSTCPVRYNGNSGTVSQEGTIYWTKANYKSTVGSASGSDASMTFNTQFSWDYDPTNGVGGYSFRDVLVHEVGHALGFVSRVDYGSSVTDMTALDLFRFQTSDGSGDYNPDSTSEWQLRPRLVDYNTPNDQHHTDLVSVEYQMSDGTPYQASHFKEQTSNIGIMDPAFASGQTYQPNYMKASDLAVFDAIGYDR